MGNGIYENMREIIGCQMKFHQKLNETEDMKPKLRRMSLQDCASSCMKNVDSCQHGWAYSSTNDKCYFLATEGYLTIGNEWIMGQSSCGGYSFNTNLTNCKKF